MLKKLRSELAEIEGRKHQYFADFDGLLNRIRRAYAPLFPKYLLNKAGCRRVYHFGVPGVAPISLEEEHGRRDHLPPRFAKFAIQGINDLLTYIEANSPDEKEKENDPEQENDNECLAADKEASGALPEPKVPDRDRGE
jgi:hypothetical protein